MRGSKIINTDKSRGQWILLICLVRRSHWVDWRTNLKEKGTRIEDCQGHSLWEFRWENLKVIWGLNVILNKRWANGRMQS